jgi:hypothetical protein
VGELNRVMTPESRGIPYYGYRWLRLCCRARVESQEYIKMALSMLQQLLQLVIPDKPRSNKVQIPKPNQLTLMFTHSYCPRHPSLGGINDRIPPLDLLLYLPAIGRTVSIDDIVPDCPCWSCELGEDGRGLESVTLSSGGTGSERTTVS